MRICVLTPTFLPRTGGVEVAIDCLARAWLAGGHGVSVLTQVPRGAAWEEVRRDYPVRTYPCPVSQRGWFLSARRRLERWHREQAFQVVHAHMAYPAGWVGWSWGRRHGLPVTITCQGGDVSLTSRFRGRPIIERRLRRCLRETDLVTAVSADLASAAQELAGGREVRVVPNGVDPLMARPVTLSQDVPFRARVEGRPFLLDMKRLHPAKGHADLLAALAELRAQGQGVPLLVIAGEGPQREELERLVQHLDLAEHVLLVGAVQGDLRRWLLQHCLALVHPSRREGMPLVVNEAMACGRAVLAVRSEGLSDQVVPGETGWLVEAGDQAALVRALAELLAADDLEALGAAGRDLVQALHWDRVAALYLEGFAQILEPKP